MGFQFAYQAGRDKQGVREGFAIVVIGWLLICALGAVPLTAWLMEMKGYGVLRAFTDGYFETMSGLSTTGATILFDIEEVPRSLLFWRALTHWLGGMGIITLAIAIFPAMGVGGYQMFRGEVAGPSADRFRPRLAESVKVLWIVYVFLTVLMTVFLYFGGMDVFDSLCHAFATLATGGFSTRNGSVAAYQSAYLEWVIIVFMFLAGVNFLLHFRLITQRDWKPVVRNQELRFYVALVVGATVFLVLILSGNGMEDPAVSYRHFQPEMTTLAEHQVHVEQEAARFNSGESAIRHSLFQVLAIVTTTGFGTADFDVWPRSASLILVVLMFFGACAGSTSGGMKLIRIMVGWKAAWREVKKVVRPHLLAPVKVERHAVQEGLISNITGFILLFFMLFGAASFLMTLFIPDLTTAVTSVIATLANIGPGLSGVGPTQSFGWIPVGGKWVLIACMLLGRLEVFTVIVMLRKSFWKR
jgi:trk system potassium uptake protein TrkH